MDFEFFDQNLVARASLFLTLMKIKLAVDHHINGRLAEELTQMAICGFFVHVQRERILDCVPRQRRRETLGDFYSVMGNLGMIWRGRGIRKSPYVEMCCLLLYVFHLFEFQRVRGVTDFMLGRADFEFKGCWGLHVIPGDSQKIFSRAGWIARQSGKCKR